jgi:hypothetical protein
MFSLTFPSLQEMMDAEWLSHPAFRNTKYKTLGAVTFEMYQEKSSYTWEIYVQKNSVSKAYISHYFFGDAEKACYDAYRCWMETNLG